MLGRGWWAVVPVYQTKFIEVRHIFGARGSKLLKDQLYELPPYTFHWMEKQLEILDQLGDSERQIKAIIQDTPAMQLLKSLPGVGMILAVVIAMEVGNMKRFSSPEKLASYAATVP
ncbi:MAG: transposase [Candidatus Helarchaeota archaeon]